MTIYVSCGAEAWGDGSALRPFSTIQQAADRAEPGDLILIGDGIYRETVVLPRGGERRASIAYAAEHPGRAMLLAAPREVGSSQPMELRKGYIFSPGEDGLGFISLEGLRFAGGAVSSGRSLFWTIEDCEIEGSPHFGLLLGDGTEYPEGVRRASPEAVDRRNGFHTVSRCRIHDCEAAGIGIFGGYAVRLVKNEVRDCGGGILLGRGNRHTEVLGNLFSGNRSEDLCVAMGSGRAEVSGNRFLSVRSVGFLVPEIAFTDNEYADGGPEEAIHVDDALWSAPETPVPAEEEAGAVEEPEQPEEPERIGANLVLVGCEACAFPYHGESFTVHEIYVRGNEVWMVSAEQPDACIHMDCEYGFFKKLGETRLHAPFSVDVEEDRNLMGVVKTLATMFRILDRTMVQDPETVCKRIRDKANVSFGARGITMRFSPRHLKFIRDKRFITLEEVIDVVSAPDQEVVAEVYDGRRYADRGV